MCDRLFLVALAVAVWPAAAQAEDAEFAVIGYLPEYRVADADPGRLAAITDLVFFGLEPPADGQLSDAPVRPAVLKKLHRIKRIVKCRLLISVGGWNRSRGFSALSSSDAARRRFIAGLLACCRNSGFDGVDYDWEHPVGDGELAAYRRLLAETRAAFRDDGLLVTVALASWQNPGRAAWEAVDRVHLMSYDHEFPQATFDKSEADIERFLRWGCPPEKIALGVPFYGRNRQREARTYGEIVRDHDPDPNADVIDGFAFNGKATIIRKVDLAVKRRLSGIMIWEPAQDAPAEKNSLLRTIDRQLRVSRSRRRTSN